MFQAYDDAFSTLLFLEKTTAAAAANTTGSDRTNRQKPLKMDTDALPTSSAYDTVQSKTTAKPMCESTGHQQAINQTIPFLRHSRDAWCKYPACPEVAFSPTSAEPEHHHSVRNTECEAIEDTDGADTAAKLRAVSPQSSIAIPPEAKDRLET